MNNCIFCRIIRGEIPSEKVFEDSRVVAFHDIMPKAPVHVLVLPKKHISSLTEVKKSDSDLLGEILVRLSDVARKLGIDRDGYKVVINNGEGSGQLVMHMHFHLLGGWARRVEGWKV